MIKVTHSIPAGAPVDSGNTIRHFDIHSTLVCVEISEGIYVEKQADQLTAADKLCLFRLPKPGKGAAIDLVETI